MKNSSLVLIMMFIASTYVFAQADSSSLKKDIEKLNSTVYDLESKYENIQKDNSSLKKSLSDINNNYIKLLNDYGKYKIQSSVKYDSIQNLININSTNIENTANDLGAKIDTTEKSANQSITDLNKTVDQNTLCWIIAVLAVALLALLTFIFLRKQLSNQKNELNLSLHNTRKSLEEEGVKLDNKLIGLLESQLKINQNLISKEKKDIDHNLALKVADEIIRIQKNLIRMDENTKGLKQLSASVQRIQDNLASNGYELIDMLGKPYHEGMKVTANFIPDENLAKDEQIITRIIKPQVNYNNVMIQAAQIEVSIRE